MNNYASLKTAIFFVIILATLHSCTKQEIKNSNNETNNPNVVSVTGNVEQNNFDEVILSSWANLDPVLLSVCTYGIEYSKDESMSSPVKVDAKTKDSNNHYTISLVRQPIGTQFYYRSYVHFLNTGIYEYGEIRGFIWKTINIPLSGAVDLGLSVKWSACDLGANNLYDDGDFFAWGETATKYYSYFTLSNYKYYQDNAYTKYNNSDNKTVLDPSDDAAHVILGGKWRMPTREEFEEMTNAYGQYATSSQVANPNRGRNTMKEAYINFNGILGDLHYNTDPKYSNVGLFIPRVSVYDHPYVKDGTIKNDHYVWWCSNMAGLYDAGANDVACAEFCYAHLYDGMEASGVKKHYGLKIRPVSD